MKSPKGRGSRFLLQRTEWQLFYILIGAIKQCEAVSRIWGHECSRFKLRYICIITMRDALLFGLCG